MLEPDDPRHGSKNGYGNLKCRCDACKAAWAARQKDYLDRHPEQRELSRQRSREWTRQRQAARIAERARHNTVPDLGLSAEVIVDP